MNMFGRVNLYVGKPVSLRTKSGDTRKGVIEAVEIDGEIILAHTFGKTKTFINWEQVESLSDG